MKRRNFILSILSVTLLTVITLLAVFTTETSAHESSILAQVYFASPLSVEEVFDMVNDTSVEVMILESNFWVGDRSVHDFYFIQPQVEVASIEADYNENRLGFFADTLAGKSGLRSDQVNELEKHFDAMEQMISDNNAGVISIAQITIFGLKEEIEKLLEVNSSKISEVQFQDQSIDTNVNEQQVKSQPSSGIQATWYPNSGTSYTYAYNSSSRYTQQYMKWTNKSFSSSQTYEHEYFLYNYNNDGTYLYGGSSSFPNCFPVVNYASTTWPSTSYPYLDTRLKENLTGCESNEVEFTIGAAKASALSNNTTYYTYFRTANGNVSTDKFKLSAQLGHRNPSSCYTTWCSWSDSRTTLIPAWSTQVPGYKSWTKQ